MKPSLLRLLFCGLAGLAFSLSAAGKAPPTKHPVENATKADLDKVSVGKLDVAKAKIAALETPTLRASIEPPRSFTLIQKRLPDKLFAIEKRWFNEFEQTPMRSTGYWVNVGDTLIVNFRYTGSQSSPMPSAWIHSLDDRTWNYGTDQKVRLRAGSNTIVARKKGAVYIAVENPPTGGIMSIDIESGGHAMPRFVLGQHASSDWGRMLQAYSDAPYAELISERAMFTLTLAHARQYVDDPVDVLETWDRIINFAEAQFGLSLSAAAPNDSPQLPYHFVECAGCNDDYMYTWQYRMAFANDQIRKVVNRRMLEKEGWGPWHEFGHRMQHDDLTMDGHNPGDDVETTVNLTSLWVQTVFFGLKSDLETDGDWSKIQNYLNQSSRDWDRQKNLFIRLGMFWQLHLAFGPRFYPRYATESRPLQGYPGGAKAEKQARVVIETSRVAGRNLIPFYEKWGMPITAATRQAVENLHLLPLDKPIWENTDMSAPYTYYGPDDELPPVGDIVAPNEVHSGDRFSAVADVSSPGGHALSYQWNHGRFENPQGGNTDTLTVTAPSVQSPTPMEVSVDVSDSKQSSTFKAEVLVEPASGGGCGGVPPWDSTKLYSTYGEQVVDQGKIYHQNFYNQNQPPHLNYGLGKPWLLVGDCPASAAPRK